MEASLLFWYARGIRRIGAKTSPIDSRTHGVGTKLALYGTSYKVEGPAVRRRQEGGTSPWSIFS
jgi:hypothetical protein